MCDMRIDHQLTVVSLILVQRVYHMEKVLFLVELRKKLINFSILLSNPLVATEKNTFTLSVTKYFTRISSQRRT